MPARPSYFHRLDDALTALRMLGTEWVDRRMVEEVLGVSKTVAWRILRQCGASDGPGNTLVCQRSALMTALERWQTTQEYVSEIRRRNRLDDYLLRLAQMAHDKQVRVVADTRAVEMVSSRLKTLPPGVDLIPGRLTIEFSGTEDFLEKVGAVVYALQNDLERISALIETAQTRHTTAS